MFAFGAATPHLAEIKCLVRARKSIAAGSLPTPVVRAALCNLYRLHPPGEMFKVSSLANPQEERLVHVQSIDTKFVVGRPADEAPAAYFLPYSIVSGMH